MEHSAGGCLGERRAQPAPVLGDCEVTGSPHSVEASHVQTNLSSFVFSLFFLSFFFFPILHFFSIVWGTVHKGTSCCFLWGPSEICDEDGAAAQEGWHSGWRIPSSGSHWCQGLISKAPQAVFWTYYFCSHRPRLSPQTLQGIWLLIFFPRDQNIIFSKHILTLYRISLRGKSSFHKWQIPHRSVKADGLSFGKGKEIIRPEISLVL